MEEAPSRGVQRLPLVAVGCSPHGEARSCGALLVEDYPTHSSTLENKIIMKIKSADRLQLLATTCLPILGAMMMLSVPTSARAQDTSSTTTTTTTQPVPAPPPITTVQTTTVTTVAPTSLYVSKAHGDVLHDGEAIYDRPDGKVYNQDGDCIGHLTNLEGSDIAAAPVHDQFKIRNAHGNLIASTRPSSAYDSDKKVMLSHQDEPAPTTTSSMTTTRQTTVSP
jgi:hypothetical protein